MGKKFINLWDLNEVLLFSFFLFAPFPSNHRMRKKRAIIKRRFFDFVEIHSRLYSSKTRVWKVREGWGNFKESRIYFYLAAMPDGFKIALRRPIEQLRTLSSIKSLVNGLRSSSKMKYKWSHSWSRAIISGPFPNYVHSLKREMF